MAIEDFQFPTIDAVAKRLYEIPNTGRVRACLEQPEDIERFEELTYGGIVQLVEEFNRIDIADPLIEFMPGVKRLKDILGNQQLPLPEEISARDFIRGLRQARELMIRGQDLSDGKILRDTHYAKAAIQTPSMNTHELALAVGTSLHLYERSVFEMMTRLGIAESTEWTKDDVLFALEDLALLMHAQSVMHSDCQDAILFDLMTFPAGSDPETDGLGWRTQEQVDESLKQYQVWVDWVLPELTRATEDLSLDDQVDSLRQILGRFNLGLPNTYGARPVIGEIVTQTFPGSVVEMVRAYKVYYQVCGITCDTDEKADRFTTAYTRVNEANDKLLMLYLCGQYFANIAQNLLNVPEDEWRESLHQIKNIEHGYRENFGLLSEPGIQSAGGIDKVVQMRDIILRLFLPEQAGQ